MLAKTSYLLQMKKNLKQQIIDGLGTEIHEAFMNDELDLVLVV